MSFKARCEACLAALSAVSPGLYSFHKALEASVAKLHQVCVCVCVCVCACVRVGERMCVFV